MLFIKKGVSMTKLEYNKCTMKEKIAIISAIVAFCFGWGLTIAGFIVPPLGDIASSVLWVLGQALIYAASVFGIAGYFSSETVKLKHDMNRHLAQMEMLQIERERLRHGIDTGEQLNKGEFEDENDDV